jgi:hypothetical protein
MKNRKDPKAPRPNGLVPFEDLFDQDHPLRHPLTAEELARQRERETLEERRTARLEHFLSYARPRVQESNRLLYADELPEETIAALKKLKPLDHHRDCPAPDLPASIVRSPHRKCWAYLLEPLAFWPSDLIRIHGPILLYHPLIAEAIRRLSRWASDPRLRENPEPVLMQGSRTIPIPEEMRRLPEERRIEHLLSSHGKEELLSRGWSAISNMDEPFQQFVLQDETEDRERSGEARQELRKLIAVLTNRSAKARSHRDLRILLRFDRLRRDGNSEAEAVSEIAQTEWSETAVRGSIQRARKALGKRTIRPHHRGRYRDPESPS